MMSGDAPLDYFNVAKNGGISGIEIICPMEVNEDISCIVRLLKLCRLIAQAALQL